MESDASEEMLSSEDLFSAEENNEEHGIQHPSVPSVPTGAKPCRRFSAAQVACLKLFYANGMTGTGRKHRSLIAKAADDTHLSIKQVKVSNEL